METIDLKDYCIADITEDDVKQITKLEQSIGSREQNDIVLIAYQPSNKTEK